MNALPRISFGMIVFNGEPFVRYNLRALYPFAHEIIVVEGAAPGAARLATPDGHSTDGTLETLYRFKQEEDPDDKLHIITRDGIWEGEKDEMSRAYASRVTGDYLWQIDSDEFYQPDDMRAVLEMLRRRPDITAVSFKTLTFWGSPDTVVDGWFLRRGAAVFHRLFRWEPGCRYVTHRPPTVHDAQGRDLRRLRWVTGREMERRSIVLYHYALLFPKQVRDKSEYYTQDIGRGFSTGPSWVENSYTTLRRPFRVHNVYVFPGWLERYDGPHPPQVRAMWDDIRSGKIEVERRPTADVERLLGSPAYRVGRFFVRLGDYPDRVLRLAIMPLVAVYRLLRRLSQKGVQ